MNLHDSLKLYDSVVEILGKLYLQREGVNIATADQRLDGYWTVIRDHKIIGRVSSKQEAIDILKRSSRRK